MSPVKQWYLQQLALINTESPAEQGCVFAWLNVGCVLHLQVADSLPAQVSGSQSVFVCVQWFLIFTSFAPTFALPSPPLRATSSFFWERRHGYSDLPLSPIVSPPPSFSSAPPHFDCLFIPKFLGTLKTPAPPPPFSSVLMVLLLAFLPKPDSAHCLETARSNFLTGCNIIRVNMNWHDMTEEVSTAGTDVSAPVCLCYVCCSYEAPSSRRSARRKPNRSQPTMRWRRWPTLCLPHPNCSTTTGKAVSPRCALHPPPQSE